MSLDLLQTTSRRAIILGMTNTDQIGMQQARAPQAMPSRPENAEVLPDAGDANSAESADGGDVDEATGLSAAELAEFEQMRTGAEPTEEPAGDAEEDNVGDDDADPDAEVDAAPAPAPAALGKEKTPAELAAEAAAGKKPGARKAVSFGKYQRELKAANEATAAAVAAAQKAREDSIKLAERVAIINEALSAPQPQQVDPNAPPANPFEEDDIDPNEDYAESVKQIQRRQRYQMENQGRVEQEVAESREDGAMKDSFVRDFNAYSGTEQGKDLPAAYQFLKDSRLTEICISEFDKDPNDPNEVFTKAEVAKMVSIFNNEEKWVVGNAIKAGKSPAVAIMKLARSRGFKPAAAAPAPAPAPAAAAAPARAVARVPAAVPAARPAVPSAADALAELAAAQTNGRSLSDGGGAPPTGLSAEMILQLDDEEFAALIDELPKHQLDALMGRMPG